MASKIASLLTAAAVAALAAAPNAIAHEGNGDERYHSQVRRVVPSSLPVAATTQNQRFERLQIRNLGSGTITVLDYEGKPYARVTPTSVFLNIAPSEQKADWRLFESKPEFAYHDHRAHWMAKDPPASVDKNPTKPQRIMSWNVPILYGERPGTIKGEVYYLPASSNAKPSPVEPAPPVANLPMAIVATLLTVVATSALYLRRNRRMTKTR